MAELSLYVDESGEFGSESKYYLVTIVFHDVADDIQEHIDCYRNALQRCSLPDATFHMSPLLYRHDQYADMSVEDRKKYLRLFGQLVSRLPIAYRTISVEKRGREMPSTLLARLTREVVSVLQGQLAMLQGYDHVEVCYDGGQKEINALLRNVGHDMFSRRSCAFTPSVQDDCRLLQVADYLCGIELAAIKYANGETGNTERLFFGGAGAFKRNYLKKVRVKRLA